MQFSSSKVDLQKDYTKPLSVDYRAV